MPMKQLTDEFKYSIEVTCMVIMIVLLWIMSCEVQKVAQHFITVEGDTTHVIIPLPKEEEEDAEVDKGIVEEKQGVD